MSKIYKFDCEVFPLKIWVAVRPTINQLKSRFVVLEDDSETTKEFDDDTIKPYWGACRITVIDKKLNDTGCLILVMRPDKYHDSILVHECCHAYDDFVDLLGCPACGETRAYVTEWIFEKAHTVITKELNCITNNNENYGRREKEEVSPVADGGTRSEK